VSWSTPEYACYEQHTGQGYSSLLCLWLPYHDPPALRAHGRGIAAASKQGTRQPLVSATALSSGVASCASALHNSTIALLQFWRPTHAWLHILLLTRPSPTGVRVPCSDCPPSCLPAHTPAHPISPGTPAQGQWSRPGPALCHGSERQWPAEQERAVVWVQECGMTMQQRSLPSLTLRQNSTVTQQCLQGETMVICHHTSHTLVTHHHTSDHTCDITHHTSHLHCLLIV
jgi:hypothetical protein